MRVLTTDPPPPALAEWLEQRRRAGADRHDEIWDGVLHMSPEPSGAHLKVQQQLSELLGPLARAAGLEPGIGGFNLGASAHDYRAPDGGLFRLLDPGIWHPTAALVIEIASPGDETWDKLDFYAAHGVDELLIVDPATRSVDWFALHGGAYERAERSALIDLGPAELAGRLDWPQVPSE